MNRILQPVTKFQERRIFFILLAVWIIMGIFYPREFFNVAVLKVTVLAMSSIAVIAVGMTVLLVSGGFDLSVGSVVTLTGIVAALVIKGGMPWFAAMAVAVVAQCVHGEGITPAGNVTPMAGINCCRIGLPFSVNNAEVAATGVCATP